MNVVSLMGNISKEPKLNQSGKVLFSSIAVQSSEKDDKGGYKARFIPFRILGEKAAATAEKYLQKGTRVGITGELVIDDVKQDDGSYKTYAYVIANRWEFGSNKSDRTQAEPEPASDDDFYKIPDGVEGEFPFGG